MTMVMVTMGFMMTEPTTEQLIAMGYTTNLREHAAEQHLLEQWRYGPALLWCQMPMSTDGDYVCSSCNSMLDEQHRWQECAKVLQDRVNGLFGELGKAESERDERLSDDELRRWLLSHCSPTQQADHDVKLLLVADVADLVSSGNHRKWRDSEQGS